MVYTTMSSTRRHKLQVLQEREAVKARMGRLQTMLQQKLIQKYGSKRNHNSGLNVEIQDEVKAFVGQCSRQPTDDDFLELENAVREIRAKYSKNCTSASGSTDGGSHETADSNRHGESRRSSKRVNDVQSRGPGNRGGGDSPSGEGPFNLSESRQGDRKGSGDGLPTSIARAWRTFDVAKQIEFEAREKEKADKAKVQKLRVREELEKHRSLKAKEKALEEEERRRHMEAQDRRLADFRAEQEALKKRASDRHAEEKALREEQVKLLQAEKETERKDRLEQERREIELCKRQLQGEVEDIERKRREEKERLAFIQAENAIQRGIRAQKQREADERDAELVREHLRKTAEEERRRAENIKDRMRRYEDIGNFWQNRGAGKAQAEAEQREEEQTLKAARRKEEADLERERREAEGRRRATIAMAAENRKVIAEKNALKERKYKEDMEFAQRYISDSQAFREEEREKIARKKAATARYRQDLEKQVAETKARREHEDMNETEFRLNSDLVKKLEADKRLVAQVKQRMESVR